MDTPIDKHLVKALVDTILFLEYSNMNVIGEDISIKVMEQIAAELQQMSPEYKNKFVSTLELVSDEYNDKADFVKKLPESLNLI